MKNSRRNVLKRTLAFILALTMAFTMFPSYTFAEEGSPEGGVQEVQTADKMSAVTLGVSTSELTVAGDAATITPGLISDAFTVVGDAAVVVSVDGDAATLDGDQLTPVKPGTVTVKAELTGENYELAEGYKAEAVTTTVTVSWPTFADVEEALAYFVGLDDDTQDLFAEDFPQYFNAEEIETAAIDVPNGYYHIQCAGNTSYYLNVTGNNNIAGTNIQIYQVKQSFYIYKDTSKGKYKIVPQSNTGVAFDYACTTGNNLILSTLKPNADDNQLWTFENSTSNSGAYVIKTAYNGKVIGVAGAYANETNVQLYDNNNSAAQSFNLVPAYSITFNSNGGSAVASQNVAQIPATLPTPTREGYAFEGWYTDGALTQAATAGTVLSTNMTLYAKWAYTYNNESYAITNSVENPVAYVLDTTAKTATAYTVLQTAIDNSDGKTVVVLKNISSVAVTVAEEKTVTLDLNGYVLKGNGSNSVIKVASNASLTVNDSNSNREHKYSVGNTGLWTWDDTLTGGTAYESLTAFPTSGTVIVKGGAITNGKSYTGDQWERYGAGIYCNGNVTLNGGAIIGNSAYKGCAVYVGNAQGTATGTINAGVIIAGNSGDFAAGIAVGSGGDGNDTKNTTGTVTMNGGDIRFNYASQGCCAVFTMIGTFNMKGGSIAYNKTIDRYGTVFVGGGTTFNMTGGSIDHNISVCSNTNNRYDSGAVSVCGTFNMTGGSITNNQGKYAGGVYVNNETNNSGTFVIGGDAIISGNTLSDGTTASNVYLTTGKTVTIDSERSPNWTRPIGVTTQVSPSTGAVAITSNNSSDYSDKFVGDNTTNLPKNYGSGSEQVVKMVRSSYTITYNLGGGTNEASNPAAYTYGEGVASFANPSRGGYTFVGWYDASAGGNKVTSIAADATGDMTLYARWEYDYSGTYYIKNQNYNWYIYDDGTKLYWNNSGSKSAYIIKKADNGYYTIQTLGGNYLQNVTQQNQVTADKNNVAYFKIEPASENSVYIRSVNGSLNLHANSHNNGSGTSGNIISWTSTAWTSCWTLVSNTITYQTNGGTLSGIGITQQTANSTYTMKGVLITDLLTLPTPTREGYVFTGWYTDSGLTTKAASGTRPSSNVTLYAGWASAEVTDSNGTTTYYTSVETAFSAATEGCTVKVLQDGTLSANYYITKSCTVDLNGHTINNPSGDTFRVNGSGVVVKLKNGTVNCPSTKSDIIIFQGAKVYVEDVKLTGEKVLYGADASAELHLEKGVVCETNSLCSSGSNVVLYITDGVYNYTKLPYSDTAISTERLYITGGCFNDAVDTTYKNYIQEGYECIDCAHERSGYKDVKASSTKPSVKEDTDSTYKPTHIVNGGFEQRPFMPFTVGSTTYSSWVAESTPAYGTTISSGIPNGVNGGWNTSETQVYNGGLFEWSNSPGTYGLSSAGDGNYFIEMNANNPSVLYQDLSTNGGDVIVWTLKHAARGGSTAQAIEVEVGAPNGTPSGQNANIKGATLAEYTYTSVSGTYGKANTTGLTALRTTSASWSTAKGIYIVPNEQSTTRFAFISTEPATGAWGNMLDAITFDTLIGNLHAVKQEDGSVKVTGYWGDSDSSKKLIIRIGGTTHEVKMNAYCNKNFAITIPAAVIGDAPSFEVYHQDYELGKKTLVLRTYESTISAKVKWESGSHIPTEDLTVDCTIAAVTAGAPLPSNPTVSVVMPKTADGTSTASWTVSGLEANNTYTYKITQSTTASGVTLDTGVMYAIIHLDENGTVTSSYQEEIADLTSPDSFVMNKVEGEASYDPSTTTIRLGSDTQKVVGSSAAKQFNTAMIKSTFSIDFTKSFTISGTMQAGDVPDGSLVGFVPSAKRATDITIPGGGYLGVYTNAENKNGIFLEFDTYGNGSNSACGDSSFGADTNGKHFALVKTDSAGNAKLTTNASNVPNSVAYTGTTFPKQELNYTIKNTVTESGTVLTFSLGNGVNFSVANPKSIFGQDTAYFLLAGSLRFGPANTYGLGAEGTSAPETKITLSKFNYLESTGEAEDYFANKYSCQHSWVYVSDGNKISAYCSKCNAYGDSSNLSNALSLTLAANDAVYSGGPYTGASFDAAQKTAWTNAGLTTPTIMYVGSGTTAYEESSTAPTSVGTYTAKIAVDDKTATKDFAITQKEITVSGITASDKVYDGNTTVSLVTSGATLTGKHEGDDLTVSATGAFDNANAGENKTVSISNLVLQGTSAPNYKLAASGQQTSTSATITKADGNVTAPTAISSLSYTGEAQELVSAGSSTTGTIQYKIGVDGTYSTAIPTATDAGTYTVFYKVVGDENHKDVAEASINVTIGKKQIAKPAADTATYTYDGTEKTYNIAANTDYTVVGNKATNAGTHIVEVKLKDITNTCWSDHTTGDLNYNFVINKSTGQTVSAANVTATYGDTNAKILASASQHGELSYAVKTGSDVISVNATTGALTLKKVGTATVTVTAAATADYEAATKDVTITVTAASMTVSSTNGIATYSGTATYGGAVVTVESPASGASITYGTTSGTYDKASIPTFTNAGTYTVYYKVTSDNYFDYKDSFTITIHKADGSVTAPTARTLSYTGEAQALINEGSSTTGTIKYRLDGENDFSTSVPTATVAGTYTVHYKVVGDGNHEDVAEASVTVTIGKKQIAKPAADTNTYTYDGTEKTYGITGNSSYTVLGNKATNAGTHKVEVKLTDITNTCWDDNTVGDLEYQFVIGKSNAQTVTADNITATYGDTHVKVLAIASQHGTLSYAVKTGSDIVAVDTTGALTLKKVGTAVVTVTAAEVANYKAATKDVTITVNPATMEVTAKNGFATHDGNATAGGAEVTVTKPNSGYAIKYGTTAGTYDSDTIPTFTDSGHYTVYYKVTAANYVDYTGSFTITIYNGDLNVTVPTAKELIYNGSALELITAGSCSVPSGTATIQYKIGADGTYSTSIPTATDVGTYTVYYKVTAPSHNDYEDSLTVTIHKAEVNVTAPTANSLTYTGSAQALINAGACSVASPNTATIEYRIGANGTYSTAIPTATDAGTYNVFYRVVLNDAAKANYNEVDESSVTVTIGKEQIAKPSADTTTYTYNGSEQTYGVATTDKYTVYGNKATNAGTHKIEVELKDTANTCWDDGSINDLEYDFVIQKSNGQTITANDVTATYGDTGVVVSATASQHGTISYAVTAGTDVVDVNATTGALTIKKAGSATVTVTAAETADYASVTKDVAITVNLATMIVSSTDGTATYDGTATNGGAAVTVDKPASGYTITYGESAGTYGLTSMPTFTNVGIHTIYYKVTADNYEDKTGSFTITIGKANGSVTAPTAKELVYSGSAQDLVNAGSSATGTIQYSLDANSGYSTVIPTATAAGTYTVFFKVVGDSNHYNVATSSVTVTIDKKKITKPSEDTTVFIYTGSEQTYGITGNADYTIVGNKATNAGTHLVEVALKDTANTCWADGTTEDLTFNFVIGKSNGQTIAADNVTATYGDTDAKVTASASQHGTITYAVTQGNDVVEVNATTGALTIKKAGTAVVTVTAAATSNYASVTKDVTITVNKATPAAINFDYTAPSATYWTRGTTVAATVAAKEAVTGMGVVTVKYYSDLACLAEVTPNADGTYYVAIHVGEGDNYEAGTKLCDESWTFTLVHHDHTWNGGAVTSEPTTASTGLMTYTCTACGQTRTEAIDMLHAHTYASTWTSDSTNHWHEATCSHSSEKSDSAAHTFGTWSSNHDATTTADGTKSRTCSVCGYKQTVADTGSKLEAEGSNESANKEDTSDKKEQADNAEGEKSEETEIGDKGIAPIVYSEEQIEELRETAPVVEEENIANTIIAEDTLVKVGAGSVLIIIDSVDKNHDREGDVITGFVATNAENVLHACLTKEERESVASGENVVLRLLIKKVEEQVPEEDAKQIEDKTNELAKSVKGLKLGEYVDITLHKQVGDSDWERVRELDEELEVSFDVPEDLVAQGRTYCVMRNHDGVCELLYDVDNNPDSITIRTHLFSTYAILYTDEAVELQPVAKVRCIWHYFIFALTLLALIGIWLLRRKNLKISAAILAFDIVLAIIFTILGSCIMDVIMLIGNIVLCGGSLTMQLRQRKI